MPSYIVQFSDQILCAGDALPIVCTTYGKTSGWAENVAEPSRLGCFSFWIKQCITSLLGSLSTTINVFWSTAGIVITEAHTVLGLQQNNYTNLINSIFGPKDLKIDFSEFKWTLKVLKLTRAGQHICLFNISLQQSSFPQDILYVITTVT